MYMFKQSLSERLRRLALLIGSNEWRTDKAPEAEILLREAAKRLEDYEREAGGRQDVLDGVIVWNNELRCENEKLRARLEDALWRLRRIERDER